MRSICLLLCSWVFLSTKLAGQWILVDGSILRSHIGYSYATLKEMTQTPDRFAHLVTLQIETRIAGTFSNSGDYLRIHDGLFAELALGYMSSTPLAYYDEAEGRFSTYLRFGYNFVPCYSGNNLGFGVGVRPQFTAGFIGETTFTDPLLQFTMPIVGTVNYKLGGSDQSRLALWLWNSFNPDKRDAGIRIDIPIDGHGSWLYLQATTQNSPSVNPANADANQYTAGRLQQLALGLRFGSIY